MNLHNARYEVTAVNPEQYPEHDMPEVAFIGRSNVGKSSIINCLLNRRNLARVGGTPGKTRVINFYNIDDTIYLVDLPGYGYAKVSKQEKASWGKLADTYLTSRKNLKLLVLLLDIRHKPTQDDMTMKSWISASGIPYIVAATKADKLSRPAVMTRKKDIAAVLSIPADSIIPFSSTRRTGREELLETIQKLLKAEI